MHKLNIEGNKIWQLYYVKYLDSDVDNNIDQKQDELSSDDSFDNTHNISGESCDEQSMLHVGNESALTESTENSLKILLLRVLSFLSCLFQSIPLFKAGALLYCMLPFFMNDLLFDTTLVRLLVRLSFLKAEQNISLISLEKYYIP